MHRPLFRAECSGTRLVCDFCCFYTVSSVILKVFVVLYENHCSILKIIQAQSPADSMCCRRALYSCVCTFSLPSFSYYMPLPNTCVLYCGALETMSAHARGSVAQKQQYRNLVIASLLCRFDLNKNCCELGLVFSWFSLVVNVVLALHLKLNIGLSSKHVFVHIFVVDKFI